MGRDGFGKGVVVWGGGGGEFCGWGIGGIKFRVSLLRGQS